MKRTRNTTRHRNHGFTLIELLVVIVIISILSALLLTAVAAAMRFSRRVRTDMEIDQLEDAWLLYRQTYSKWPDTQLLSSVPNPETRKFTIDDKIGRLLSGVDEDGQNARGYTFMTFKHYATDDTPVTLWYGRDGSGGTPTDEQKYYCKFDTDYNNVIQQAAAFPPGVPPTTDVRASVIVWTVNGDSGEITGSWQR